MQRFSAFVVVALACLVALPAQAAERSLQLVGRSVTYWSPAGTETARAPAIIFSHGYKGCATQSRFLMQHLALHGYWVFAPNHADAACDSGGSGLFQRPEETFRHPAEWSDRTHAERGQDIRIILSALRQQPQFAERVDWARVGLLGHSLGGYTVLGLAGAWPGWTMPNIKAVAALAPYTRPFNMRRTVSGIRVPVMLQGGARDLAISPDLREAGSSYDQAPAPKLYIEITGAGHFAWTDLQPQGHAAINAWTLAFFDHYVAGRESALLWNTPRDGVSDVRMDIGSEVATVPPLNNDRNESPEPVSPRDALEGGAPQTQPAAGRMEVLSVEP